MTEHLEQADWRPILAALANPHARRLFAAIVLDESPGSIGLSPSKQRQATAMLVRAGLVREVEGQLVEQPGVFGRVLVAAAEPRATGPERFLDERGEIDRYPYDATERRALLRLVADRVLAVDEVLSEAELNERLATFGPDTAALRRAMVDEEILERTRSGSEYARVADPAQ
ncbi:DUF2087 domain-containing protein [Occultella gossypii]|uniref:DUF2087 domain-containing protein n=1 Tax=Occultella gossypii TaxID=2800820 RepID=A0ABS7SER5_9MICO|nr:DUF2087 domain-containing protein [Occultella gossypii]MBZ2198855.1 DUF2087 domain-containing protein [Occultella gossypii]